MKLPPDVERKCLELAQNAPVEPGQANLTSEALDVLSEKAWLWKVINYAEEQRGWKVYHVYHSQRSNPGFPDLILIREKVIVMELKTSKGKPTKAQLEWLEAFRMADAGAYLFRPSDWEEVKRVLQ